MIKLHIYAVTTESKGAPKCCVEKPDMTVPRQHRHCSLAMAIARNPESQI